MKEGNSLGAIALLKNEGKPSAALSDLMKSVVGMCVFIHKRGAKREVVLEVYDELLKAAREALVTILDEDEEKLNDD